MPTVPTIGETPQVAPLQVSGIRSGVSPQDFGAGMASNVRGISRAVASDYFEELKEAKSQADTFRLMDKRNKLAEKLSPKIAEWQQRKGEDTLKSPGEADAFVQSTADELSNDLPDHLKQQFLAHAQTERVNIGRSLMIHSSAAMEQMKNATFKSRLDSIQNIMIASPYDDGLTNVAIREAMYEIKEYNKMTGVPEDSEITKNAMSDVRSGLSRLRVESLMKENADLLAQEVGTKYLEDGSLVGKDAIAVKDMIETSKYINKSDAIVASAMALDQSDPKFVENANALITKETANDQKLRNLARTEFDTRLRVMKEAEREQNNDAVKQLYDMAEKKKGYIDEEVYKLAYGLGANSKTGGGAMVVKAQDIFKDYNTSRMTDGLAFMQLQEWVEKGEVAKMTADAFYRKFYNRFSPGDWNDALRYYFFATSPEKLTPEVLKATQDSMGGFVTEKEYISNILKEWGYDYKAIEKLSATDKQTSSAYAVLDALNKAISNKKAELSRERKFKVNELSPEEIKNTVSPVLMFLVDRYKKTEIPQMKPVTEVERRRVKDAYRSKYPEAPELSDDEADKVYRQAAILGRVKK